MKIKFIIPLFCLFFVTNIAKTQCLAGSIPPTLLSYSLHSTCPESTVNLNNIIDPAIIPSNCNLIWFKNEKHTGEQVADIEYVSTGFYYAFYYDYTNDCYSPASNPVYVETISCDDCTQKFLKANPMVIGGDLPVPTGTISGLVFVKADFKFPTGTIFSNAEVLVEPNVTISPLNGGGNSNAISNLYIFGSHFYTCDNPWEGIKLFGTSNLTIDNIPNAIPQQTISSFIEDAKVAVEINYGLGKQTANGDPSRIIIKNTIFNRNDVSIKIHNLTDPDAWANNANPVVIVNNLFTCRNIFFDMGANKWDNLNEIANTSLAKGTGNIWNSYEAPFFQSSNKNSEYGPRAVLKGDDGYIKPSAGILLVNNSCQQATVCTTPQAITIGSDVGASDNAGNNIFDNLNVGIRVNTSNVNVFNSVFQKLKGLNTGIYADGYGGLYGNPEPSSYNYFINTRNPNPIITKNGFYSVQTGIYLAAIHKANIEDCYFASDLDATKASSKINYRGIHVESYNFNDIKITNNELYNIKYPIDISIVRTTRRYLTSINIGRLQIIDNLISKQIANYVSTGGYTPPNGYVHLGINVYNVNVANKYPTNFEIYNNKLFNVYNGINCSSLKNNAPIITNNEISLAEDFNVSPKTEQYGIKIEASRVSKITENYITGLGWFADDDANYQSIKPNSGILIKSTIGNQILCNDMMHCKNGIKFFGNNNYSGFYENRMHPNNQIGFMLDNSIIGLQGSNDPNEPDDAFHSNNSWLTAANAGSGWDAGNDSYTMFCNNSDPKQSTFVLQAGAANDRNPIANGGSWSASQNAGTYYDNNLGLTYSTMPDGSNIVRQEWCTDKKLNWRKKITRSSFITNEIADGSIALPNDQPVQRLEVMQQELFELAEDVPTLATNQPIVQQFLSSNQLSGFASIRLADYFNSLDDLAGVKQVLDNWNNTPTNLEENYKAFYNWLVVIDSGGTIDTSEILAVANKCPLKEGNAVYAARNLYNYLTNTINDFEESCVGAIASRGSKKSQEFIRLKQPAPAQVQPVITCRLYPTVANDFVTIESKSGIKSINIVNGYGKVITTNNYGAINHLSLNINHYPIGIYLVKIIDTKNVSYTLKFVKN